MNITEARGLDPAVVTAVEQAAAAVGAQSTVVHQGSLDLLYVVRGADASTLVPKRKNLAAALPAGDPLYSVVQAAPSAMGYPMLTIAVDPSVIGITMGDKVSSVIAQPGVLVMSSASAALRKAKVGDVVAMAGWNGTPMSFTIGLIASESATMGAEVVLSTDAAAQLGFNRPNAMRVWGMSSRAALTAALAARMPKTRPLQIRFGPINAAGAASDSGQIKTKQLLGEFAMRRTSGIFVQQDPAWIKANLVTAVLPIIGTVRCNKKTVEAATAALEEISKRGLASAIDVRDTQRSGGCWTPRELRTDSGTSGRILSRHAWGGALDINPSTNQFGGVSHIDPRVVAIFEKHGFAWGGRFLIPDGMHFDFIGKIPDDADIGEDLMADPVDDSPVLPPESTTSSPTASSSTAPATSTTSAPGTEGASTSVAPTSTTSEPSGGSASSTSEPATTTNVGPTSTLGPIPA